MKNTGKSLKIKSIIVKHVIDNKKDYILMVLLFVIGIFMGVLFINSVQQEQYNNIQNYINDFIQKLKNIENIDTMHLLKCSVWQNIILAAILWFFGTTVIGMPIVFGLVIYRGFCLGYTVSACISALGMPKGLAFIFGNLFLQNIIFIPALFGICASGLKLYKSIVKDKRRENIKLEIVRHTVFSIFMALAFLVASLIEVFASNCILKMIIQYL